MMSSLIENRLKQLLVHSSSQNITESKLIGIEKESLRILNNGELANNPHPKNLGAKLTHKSITTDYAESQLELITKPYNCHEKALEELHRIHSYIYHTLHNRTNNETLWPYSIPALIPKPKDIKIADFGCSAHAQFKELYRMGLGYRYGKTMQLMCGIHFNFSFGFNFWHVYFDDIARTPKWGQNEVNNRYMGIIRNYIRYSWLGTYLFGASPIINNSFIEHDTATANYLKKNNNSYIGPFATSIRQSNLGYQNKNNLDIKISYNSLDQYITGLRQAISTIDPQFTELGLTRRNKQIQLNTHSLQIENEYYGLIRPKPNIKIKNLAIHKALTQSGIDYIELRDLDINPFSPIGLDNKQCIFLEVLLFYCCLMDSPEFTTDERAACKYNKDRVALLGRQPGLLLKKDNTAIKFTTWAQEIFTDLIKIAEFLDNIENKNYVDTINYYNKLLDNPNETLSGKLYNNLISSNTNYIDFFLEFSKQYSTDFRGAITSDIIDYYTTAAEQSLLELAQLETQDKQNNYTVDKLIEDYFN